MKPLHLLSILFLLSCGVSRETIRYELPPKQTGDNPDKLQSILAFKTKDAEKLFDKNDSLLEGKEDELKKIAGKESSNPIVLKALARIDGKLTNLDKAKSIYEKAGLTNNSHYAWVLHDYGDYYLFKKDNDLVAEEFYNNSLKIFESLGDIYSLSIALPNQGYALTLYIDSYLENGGEKNFDSKTPKLYKVIDLFLKEETILNSKDFLANQDSNKRIVANKIALGETYKTLWAYKTGKPVEKSKEEADKSQKNLANTLPFGARYVFSDYKDYEIAKSYFDEAYTEAKKKGYYKLALDCAFQLGYLHYILYQDTDIDLIIETKGRLKRADYSDKIDFYSNELDSKHTNKILASKYFNEASEFSKKNNAMENSIRYLHISAMVYPKASDSDERRRLFENLLQRAEAEFKNNKSLLNELYLIKMDAGIAFIEDSETEKEIVDYYKSIIEDKRFTKEFIKENLFYWRNNPRDRLSKYFSSVRNFCEAAKWEKINIEYTQLFSKEKPDSKNLERYDRKCKLVNSTKTGSFLSEKKTDKKQEEKMLSSNELNSMLLDTILGGNVSKLNDVIDKGASPNSELDREYKSEKTTQDYRLDATAIMLATGEGQTDIVSSLIKKGANINQIDSQEFTALHYAVFQNRKEIVRLLIENKADVNLGIYSALMTASENNYYAIAKILIENNANVNAINEKGNTALMLASRSGNLEIVDFLIKNKADINLKNRNGYTAFQLALKNKQEKVVELLRSKGAKE